MTCDYSDHLPTWHIIRDDEDGSEQRIPCTDAHRGSTEERPRQNRHSHQSFAARDACPECVAAMEARILAARRVAQTEHPTLAASGDAPEGLDVARLAAAFPHSPEEWSPFWHFDKRTERVRIDGTALAAAIAHKYAALPGEVTE